MSGLSREQLEAHPKEVRALAYEIWAFLCDHNATKTAERLNNPGPHDEWEAPEREVSRRTISAWAQRDNWAEKAAKSFREVAPGIHSQVSQSLVAASVESAAYLRSVVNDPGEQTKFRVDAAKTILDRAGHLPYVRPKDDTKPLGPQKDYSEAIAGKSGDDLLALILGGSTPEPEPEDEIIEVMAHDADH